MESVPYHKDSKGTQKQEEQVVVEDIYYSLGGGGYPLATGTCIGCCGRYRLAWGSEGVGGYPLASGCCGWHLLGCEG